MRWRFWNKTSKPIDAFAVELATFFFGTVSPDALAGYFRTDDGDKKTRKNIELQIHNLVLRINQFKDLHRVGVYGKAKFHQVFMARLAELGYDETAVKELNRLLLIRTP